MYTALYLYKKPMVLPDKISFKHTIYKKERKESLRLYHRSFPIINESYLSFLLGFHLRIREPGRNVAEDKGG